jgi:hypothetical protein
MKQFPITDLARIIKARCKPAPKPPSYFTGANTDSRTIKSGDCFFAIRGDNFDGHDYLSDAFDKGAVCAVVDKNSSTDGFAGKILLEVDDTIKALGLFAAHYRSVGKYKVVAITGSVGKTTTRQIAYHVLSRHFHCYQAPKNFNNNIGLPLTLLGADAADKVIIAELGTNHPGEIAYLARIAKPDVALVTNIYPAHLEGFGDLLEIQSGRAVQRAAGLFIPGVVAHCGFSLRCFPGAAAGDWLRGAAHGPGALATRLAGSSDLYAPARGPGHSVNFITSHDGVTLAYLQVHARPAFDAK